MTQEDKQLLLKDLCARLPYEVKGRVYAENTKGEYDINGDMIFFDSPFDVTLDDINTSTEEIHVIAISNEDTVDFIEDQQINGEPYTIDEFKPYLRPMSSMTEDERNEYFDFRNQELQRVAFAEIGRESAIAEISDWLNSHQFDYRGLIEKRLAIEVTEGMYTTE